MPSFGATHDDQEVWGIVAFVETLGELSPEQYRVMKEHVSGEHPEHEHP